MWAISDCIRAPYKGPHGTAPVHQHQDRKAFDQVAGVNRLVPRIIQRIAVQASKEVVEKWSGRLIPIASSFIGGGLNYYFVRAWGQRARNHFREKHLRMRGPLALLPS